LAVECQRQRGLDLGQPEGLDQVDDRLEASRAAVREVDAGADEGGPVGGGAKGLSALNRGRVGRLEDDGVDAAEGVVVGHGLVAHPGNDAHQKLAHLGVGLADEHSCHTLTIVTGRSNVGCIWYGTGMKRSRILVVDDDRDIRGLLREFLSRAGYDVSEAESGKAGLREFYASPPDLVLLDVSMPELDGWQTLERIRDLSEVPVMMLTARAGELEKVRGLKGGADDYVTKPFGRQELLARVEALLRRSGPRSEEPTTYGDGLVTIDFTQREVTVGGTKAPLTPLEFKLLTVFVRHPNQVLSHEQLLELVWGDALSGSRARAKLYVGYLRQKLAEAGAEENLIETVRGFGYRYRPRAA
jgi:DNA-binding response OmpR family regulator